ncbi:MAG: diaminopimelate epimerase [Candidatus Methanomethylophilaceae archaeon]|nr:diaminopimelate epimerase [Candidatus Methanomethylophilaceae archaeon]
MNFWKYHGLGNDFVLFENLDGSIPMDADFVTEVCDRRFGVGADGILYVCPSEKADYAMRIMNADGSEAEMCGNGIRCMAKHLFDHDLVTDRSMTIDTLAGVMSINLQEENGVTMVEVNMGAPELDCRRIPMDSDGQFLDSPLPVPVGDVMGTAVSMGNPHFVTFDDLSDEDVEELGPYIEHHPLFPRKTNVEFVTERGGRLYVRVFERGAGWTLACGTGACATAVAAALKGIVPYDSPVEVFLPGGMLRITVESGLRSVTMNGPAEIVFKGKLMR